MVIGWNGAKDYKASLCVLCRQGACFDSNSATANQLWSGSFLDQSKGQEMPVRGVCMMLVHNGIGEYNAKAIMTLKNFCFKG